MSESQSDSDFWGRADEDPVLALDGTRGAPDVCSEMPAPILDLPERPLGSVPRSELATRQPGFRPPESILDLGDRSVDENEKAPDPLLDLPDLESTRLADRSEPVSLDLALPELPPAAHQPLVDLSLAPRNDAPDASVAQPLVDLSLAPRNDAPDAPVAWPLEATRRQVRAGGAETPTRTPPPGRRPRPSVVPKVMSRPHRWPAIRERRTMLIAGGLAAAAAVVAGAIFVRAGNIDAPSDRSRLVSAPPPATAPRSQAKAAGSPTLAVVPPAPPPAADGGGVVGPPAPAASASGPATPAGARPAGSSASGTPSSPAPARGTPSSGGSAPAPAPADDEAPSAPTGGQPSSGDSGTGWDPVAPPPPPPPPVVIQPPVTDPPVDTPPPTEPPPNEVCSKVPADKLADCLAAIE